MSIVTPATLAQPSARPNPHASARIRGRQSTVNTRRSMRVVVAGGERLPGLAGLLLFLGLPLLLQRLLWLLGRRLLGCLLRHCVLLAVTRDRRRALRPS